MDKVGSIWEISVFSFQLYYKTKTALKKNHWEFPGGSMVRTSCFHCRSTGLMPGWRTVSLVAQTVKRLPAVWETQI